MKKITLFCLLFVMLVKMTAMAANKTVVIPLHMKSATENSDKLYGQGRTGTSLLTHDTPAGYCNADGINFALSYHIATWNGAASVCPSGTWVCSQDEVNTGCLLPSGTYTAYLCDGSALNSNSMVLGWNAGADTTSQLSGQATYTSNTPLSTRVCNNLHVWCCWN